MRHLLRPLPVLLLTLVAGCESLQFRGTSPNVRSFSEDPSLAQSYIGFDFEFALTDPDPNKPESAQTRADPQAPEDPDIIPQPLPEPRYLPW
ncbi:MAG: hypothetical protein JWN40_4073 [Phycisphaerales bacterium]|nr:hypothetical protein [Phycisphaerales bacterium]